MPIKCWAENIEYKQMRTGGHVTMQCLCLCRCMSTGVDVLQLQQPCMQHAHFVLKGDLSWDHL